MGPKMTQCSICGVILEQDYDLEEHSNIVAICIECFNQRLLANNNELIEPPDHRVLH